MTDREAAESMVRGLAKELGREVPVELAVELGAFIVSKLSGQSWAEAIAAGRDARERVVSEADAERSRRARMQDGEP